MVRGVAHALIVAQPTRARRLSHWTRVLACRARRTRCRRCRDGLKARTTIARHAAVGRNAVARTCDTFSIPGVGLEGVGRTHRATIFALYQGLAGRALTRRHGRLPGFQRLAMVGARVPGFVLAIKMMRTPLAGVVGGAVEPRVAAAHRAAVEKRAAVRRTRPGKAPAAKSVARRAHAARLVGVALEAVDARAAPAPAAHRTGLRGQHVAAVVCGARPARAIVPQRTRRVVVLDHLHVPPPNLALGGCAEPHALPKHHASRRGGGQPGAAERVPMPVRVHHEVGGVASRTGRGCDADATDVGVDANVSAQPGPGRTRRGGCHGRVCCQQRARPRRGAVGAKAVRDPRPRRILRKFIEQHNHGAVGDSIGVKALEAPALGRQLQTGVDPRRARVCSRGFVGAKRRIVHDQAQLLRDMRHARCGVLREGKCQLAVGRRRGV